MIYVCATRMLLALTLMLAVCGCATNSSHPAKAYSSGIIEVLSGKAFLGHEVSDSELPNHDLFNVTPEMEAFAKKAIRYSDNYFDRVKRLHVALLTSRESGGLGLIYNAYTTEVPSVTFEQRRANCLSFTLLYVALARSVGINAQVNEVEIPPTWDLRNKKEMVFLRHVNVKVPILRDNPNVLNNDDVVIDLEMDRYRANYTQRQVKDSVAAAQFYSNRAMEYLEHKNMVDAFLSLRKSISLDDQQSYVWSNLGALYSRKSLWKEAEVAYLHGLELNPDDLTIMNNLSYIYNQTGNKEQTIKYSKLAQRYRESNPFFQYTLALSAFDQKDYPTALQYVTRAISRKNDERRFFELAATIYEKQARPSKVAEMLNKAKKLKINEVYKDE